MHTERVTYLATADQKAALEAFAKERGESVGSVLREAAARYMGEPQATAEEEQALKLLVQQLEEAVPAMHASLDRSIARLKRTNAEIDRKMRDAGLWK
ncbi:MAG: hypothetical protein ACTHKM_09465 [Tsuneonella sp.]